MINLNETKTGDYVWYKDGSKIFLAKVTIVRFQDVDIELDEHVKPFLGGGQLLKRTHIDPYFLTPEPDGEAILSHASSMGFAAQNLIVETCRNSNLGDLEKHAFLIWKAVTYAAVEESKKGKYL